LGPAASAAWDRLAARATEPNPFFERAFVAIASEKLGVDDVAVLHAPAGEEWAGCMPVRVTRTFGVRTVVSGWRHPYSFLGTPLVDGDRLDDFATALIRSVASREHGRYLALHRSSGGPVLESIRRAAETGGVDLLFEREAERAALERRPDGDYLSGLKSKRRSELKRQRRRLGESLEAELEARERADTGEAVEAFLRLEASGWKGKSGTAMASDERATDFFRAMCAEFAGEGRLRIRSLEADGRVLAMTCDLRAGDSLFGFKTAFDEELSRFSPGIQLQIDNFADFHERRSERYIDSCSEPDNETMNSLWPDRRSILTLLLGRHSFASGAIARAIGGAYEVRARRSASGSARRG
jgi:CelD/BcsL family acetyltransferase involved in cellulose biosynthesis